MVATKSGYFHLEFIINRCWKHVQQLTVDSNTDGGELTEE